MEDLQLMNGYYIIKVIYFKNNYKGAKQLKVQH